MATATASPALVRHPNRSVERLFFTGMAIVILVSVAIGFARTYYLAGVFRAKLPAPIIHVHGAVFSCWVLLLIVQTGLISARRVDLHRRVGVLGFGIACLMVILGVLAATSSLHRNFAPPGLDPLTFYVIPMTDMLIFSVLAFFAWRARFDPAAHKRLILIATIALMVAPIVRWPFAWIFLKPLPAQLITYLFLLALVIYDFWSLGKIHRATLWASIFLIVVQMTRVPLAQTAPWHAIAGWIQQIT